MKYIFRRGRGYKRDSYMKTAVGHDEKKNKNIVCIYKMG